MTLALLSDAGRTSGMSLLVLSWFLSYVLHALVWAAGALSLTRLSKPSFATCHTLWKLALFAPLATALWSVALPEHGQQLRTQVVEARVSAREQNLDAVVSDAPRPVASQPASGPPSRTYSRPVVRVGGYAHALALLLLSCAALGVLRFVVAVLRFWRELRGRTRVRDARLLARLARLRLLSHAARAITLTQSAHIQSPLILGTREICVPARFFGTLSEHEIDAVFAHELAHLERGDGLWFPLVGLLQTVLWFAPLNHLLSARFRETAELSCDDRALALTGDAYSLARALTRLAEAALASGQDALTPAMARSARGLTERVERLLRSAPYLAPKRWLIASLALLGLSSVGLSVHGVEARAEQRAHAGAATPSSLAAPMGMASALADAQVVAGLSAEMSALAEREVLLEAELQPLLARSAAPGTEPMRVLLLQQALRHVRGERTWLEQRVRAAPLRARERPATEGDRPDAP